jgi:quercetin 2,3-dioxygenase
MKPRYQELDAEQIPEGVSEDGKVRVKVIGGESLGVKAKVDTIIPVMYLDVIMQSGTTFTQPSPQDGLQWPMHIEGEHI